MDFGLRTKSPLQANRYFFPRNTAPRKVDRYFSGNSRLIDSSHLDCRTLLSILLRKYTRQSVFSVGQERRGPFALNQTIDSGPSCDKACSLQADHQTEMELVAAALQGNSAAFESLVERYQTRLFNAMIHVTGSTEDAEDVVQEAFIQAYLKLNTFQQNSRFYTWVYRIAFNFALSKHRRRRPVRSLDQTRECLGSEPISPLEGAENRMIQTEHILAVQMAIQELSEDHRSILVLRDMQGMSYEDIAEVLDTPIGTVRSRLNRARLQLKAQLEKRSDWQ